jgi:glucose-6-phosphate 1-dehydrogenase
MSQSLPSTTLAIFGVTGDLSKRKLLPALAEICQNSDIRAHLNILGISRREMSAAEILPASAKALAKQFSLLQMDYDNEAEYKKLRTELDRLDSEQVIFYFAVPPEAGLPIVKHLGKARLNSSKYKLLMEKPFGTDLESAKRLIRQIDNYFKEEQVYRIDHFLAKEMAQNITVFLGSNALFRDVWNNQFIERIEIVAEESLGVEGRANFYEQTGALRDIVQSHLLQLTALTIMEPCPDVFDFSMVRPRRLTALKQLEVDFRQPVIRAQYRGYKKEVGNLQSPIETFVSLNLKSSNPKWKGVPIQLVTGKRLNQKLTEIRVHFKKTQSAQTNLLKLRVQPKEAIELELWVKKPGYDQDLEKLPLDFSYQQHFDRLPDAYEQVIVDAVRSRANLFASSDEVLASWEILQPVLDKWQKTGAQIKTYKPGSSVKDILSIVK